MFKKSYKYNTNSERYLVFSSNTNYGYKILYIIKKKIINIKSHNI